MNIMKSIYAGPGSYFIDSYNADVDLFIKESSNDVVENFDDIKISTEMGIISNNLTSKSMCEITALDLNTWVGIRETTMYKYKDWINYDNICGSYATAIMLSYYQYNVLDSINNSRRCVIELYSSSSYGAHFVLAYQYYEQGDYGYLFKIVDNWGNHAAKISNEWVRGWVRITDV